MSPRWSPRRGPQRRHGRRSAFAGRKKALQAWKSEIADGARDLAAVISRETGKTPDDALLEVVLTLTHLDWASKNAHKVLARQKVPSGLASYNQHASVGYEPFGVVGVIGPWNYPFYTPMGSISYAISAGNAIVFKPSELTPATATWIEAAFRRAVPDHAVFRVVIGDGETGAALARSGVDKVAFTGSPRTARKVMAACAENLTPLVVEAGGKDAMIVAADADLDAAVGFAVFGGVGDSGLGRIHGADGLREFSVAKSIAVQKSKPFIDLLTMERSARDMHLSERMLHMLHGGKGKH